MVLVQSTSLLGKQASKKGQMPMYWDLYSVEGWVIVIWWFFFSLLFSSCILYKAHQLKKKKITTVLILCVWPHRPCVMPKCPSPAPRKLSHAQGSNKVWVPKAELTHLGEFHAWSWGCALGGMQAGCPFCEFLFQVPTCPQAPLGWCWLLGWAWEQL